MKIEDLIGKGVQPYFDITVPDPKKPGIFTLPTAPLFSSEEVRSKTMSLKISEKESAPTMIDLSVNDDTGRLNKKYGYGFKVDIEWGLKPSTNNVIQNFLKRSPICKDEIKGSLKRGPLRCHFVNYSPSMANGIVTSNISMRAGNITAYNQISQTYINVTPFQIITKIAALIGVRPVINFTGMDVPLTKKTSIYQAYETHWQFLRKLAFQFNSKLVMQDKVLYFIEWPNQYDVQYAENRNLTGVVHILDYGTQAGKIISGSFDQNMNSPNGSTITFVTAADGTTHSQFSASPTEEVVIWELNPERIKAELKKRNLSDRTALLNEILALGYEDFDKVKNVYFTPRKTTTAPEGYGYTGKLKILPNPDIVCGDLLFIGSENSLVPPQFKSRLKTPGKTPFTFADIDRRTLWRVTACDQLIDASNYTMDLEIAK